MSISRKRSLFSKVPLSLVLIVPFVTLVVGSVTLVSYLSYQSGQQAIANLAHQLLRQTSERVSDRLDNYLQRSQQIVAANQLAVKQGTLNLDDQEQLREQLWQQIILNPSLLASSFWSDAGTVDGYLRIASKEVLQLAEKVTGKTIPLGSIFFNEIIPNQRRYYTVDAQGKPSQLFLQFNDDFRDSPWYKQARAIGKQAWTPISLARVIPMLQIVAVAPVYDANNKFYGFFTANYFLSDISLYLSQLKFTPTGHIFIIERSGELVATSVAAEASGLKQVNGQVTRLTAIDSQDKLTREVSKQLLQQFGSFDNLKESRQFDLNIEGSRQFVQITPYQDKYGLNWQVVTIIPESDFITEIQANAYRTGLLCISALIVSVGIGIWTSRRIGRSLSRLTQATKSFSEQRLEQPIPNTSINEVRALKEALIQMMVDLRDADQMRGNYQQDLERQVAEKTIALTEAQRIARIGSWEFDVATGESIWSEQQFRILGFDPNVPLPLYADFFDILPLEDRPKLRKVVEEAIAYGPPYEVEHRIFRPDHSICHIVSRGEAIRDENGKVIKLIGTITDITAQKEAQKTLELQSIIMNNMAGGVCLVKAADLAIVYTNPKFDAMFGYAEGELVGQPIGVINYVPTEVTPDVSVLDIATQIDRDGEAKYEVHNRKKDGTLFWCRVHTSRFEHPEYGSVYVAVQQDITELKQTDLALQAKETQLRELATASPSVIYTMVEDKNGKICFEYISLIAEEIHEVSISEIYQDASIIMNQMHPDDLQGYLDAVKISLENLHPFIHEWRIITPSGKIKWLRANSRPSHRENGDTVWHGIASDISDRKQLEIELQVSESKLNDILNSATAAITRVQFKVDGTWDISYVSKGVEFISGYSPSELIDDQNLWFSCINPEDWQGFRDQIYADIFAQRSGTYIYRFKHKDNSQRWISQTTHSRWDENQNVYVATFFSTDISARKQTEELLQKSETALIEAQRIAHIGNWSFDIQSQKITWSKELFHMFGLDYNQPEPSYADYLQLIYADDRVTLQRYVERAIADGTPYSIDYRIFSPDGSIRYHEGRAEVEINDQGQVVRLFGTNLDITERKQFATELASAKEKAEADTKAKSAFLANMSHEIRTPMNGVLGMAQILETTELTEEQADFVKTIKDSGEALLTVINEILDFSKIESGRLELEEWEFVLEDVVSGVCKLLENQANDKNITLQYAITPEIPLIVMGDYNRLRQILLNIVGNAVKFTKQGQVSISVTGQPLGIKYSILKGKESKSLGSPSREGLGVREKYQLKFAITDTGIGIKGDRINHLFQPFTQADASVSRKYGGTGLGLAISKRLVELMHGTIWVESFGQVGGNPPADWQPSLDNQGSTFHFAIIFSTSEKIRQPLESSIKKIAIDQQFAEKLPLRILLVEDNQVNQMVACALLKKLGYDVADIANNGFEALQALRNHTYDLILMDLQMPEMDGLTTAKIIRNQLMSQVKIVAMTADVMPADRQACIDAGMNDFVSKPINIQEIMRVVSSLQ